MILRNSLITWTITILFVLPLWSQPELANSPIKLSLPDDSCIVFWVSLDQKDPMKLKHFNYTYFNKGQVHETIGGYVGYPLDGEFMKTSQNGKLLVKGKFKCGLKVGIWQSWDTQGNLISKDRWKKGKFHKTLDTTFPRRKRFWSLFKIKRKEREERKEKKE